MGLSRPLAQQEPSGSQPRSGDQTGLVPFSRCSPSLCLLSLVDYCRLSCSLNFRLVQPSFTVPQDYIRVSQHGSKHAATASGCNPFLASPNSVNPKTRGSATVIFNIVLSALLLFFIALRIFT